MSYSIIPVVRDYVDKNNKSAIAIRITFDRKIQYYTTGLKIEPNLWKNDKVIGRSDRALNTNILITKAITEYQQIILDMKMQGIRLTHRNFKECLEDKQNKKKDDDFFDFCENCLKNFDVHINTEKTYRSFLIKLKDFQKRIRFDDLDLSFIERFNKFLKEQGYEQNTIWSYHKRMKKFVNRAVHTGLLDRSPYQNFKVKKEPGMRNFLNMEEVQKIEDLKNNKHISANLLRLSKIFLFSCYTGLRYSDIKNLKWKDIQQDKLYLKTEKSAKPVSFPLSDRAKKHLPEKKEAEQYVFQIASNQKVNQQLKLIAMYADIDKYLNYHVSRHTFATLSLSLGIPLRVIQSVLGHSSYSTTEIYAKIIDKWVDTEMDKWNA